MCLIAFAIGTDPSLPLLLAGNRDEFFERPTDPLHRWADAGGIWAGRDRRDGGTWLGLGENGRVALLTNVRSPQAGPGQRSRGELVTRWLAGDQPVDEWAAGLEPAAYGGFNLVVGDLRHDRWTWLCNRDPQAPHQDRPHGLHRQDLAPGVYGLSNAVLDTPWSKTRRLKAALQTALPAATGHADWVDSLQAALADDRLALPAELPSTGVSHELERSLSSPFVRMPDRGYGTRSSLIARVRRMPTGRHSADLLEWTHSRSGWNVQGPSRHRLDC